MQVLPARAIVRALAAIALSIALTAPLAHALTTVPDLRGVYVGGNNIINENPTSLNAALSVNGIDGLLLNIGWDQVEPSMGQYDWSVVDLWMNRAIAGGKKITLSVGSGAHTPAWLFQAAPSGAGATPLSFSISRKGGASNICDAETIAAPWDPAFLAQWDAMLSALSAHLKSVGNYNALTLLRLTGINRDTDELHLPAETAQSTGLACVSDSVSTWLGAGYRPSLLLQGWTSITGSFLKYFSDKSFTVALIDSGNPFPPIADDGSIISFTNPKTLSFPQNQPLMSVAGQKFPGHLVIQNNSLYPTVPAQPNTIQFVQSLSAMIAFQTNEDLASPTGKVAGCGTSFSTAIPCTASTYIQMLETGIFPLGQLNPLRAQYIELFASDAVNFPSDILQAHQELTCPYTLNFGGQAFSSQGGTGAITISTGAGCPWNIGTPPSWVILTSATSGMGNGSVSFQVLPNNGADQSGTFTIAGQSFTIEQSSSTIAGLVPVGSLAQVASEGTWDFTLDALNLGSSPAVARFNFFADPAGGPLALPLTFPQLPPASGPEIASTLDRTINPNAVLAVDSTGPVNAPALIGWSQMLSNGNVSGFGIFSNPTQHWNAVVPLETRNAPSYLLPFDNTGTLTTGLAIANLTAQATVVPVIIRATDGTFLNSAQILLSGLGHTSFMLNQQYAVTSNRRGTIEFDTPPSGQISVLGVRANGPALTTLPLLANVGTTGGAIAHSTYNGGFTSSYYLVNAGAAQASFTLSFFDESGNPSQVPLSMPDSGTTATTAAFTQALKPGAMTEIDTIAQDALPLIQGSAQLTTTGNISGFEVFRWTTFGQEASVPLETRTPNSFVLIFDDTNGLTTGLALSNVSNQAASVAVNIRDDTGALLQTTFINVPARGHTSFMLPDTYASAVGKRGTVEFLTPTGGRISVIGVRATPTGTLTTIPVMSR